MADRDLGGCHRLARSHHPPRCHQLQHFKTLILSYLSHVTPPVCQDSSSHPHSVFFLKFSKCHWRCIIHMLSVCFWHRKTSKSFHHLLDLHGWGVQRSCCGHTFKTFPLKWWIISSDVICPRWCSVQRPEGRQAGRQAVKLDAWFILHLGSSANQCEGTTLHYTSVEL